MTDRRPMSDGQKSYNGGGKWIPALCNIAGILMLLFVLISCVPVAVTRVTGHKVYHVVSGSMEPEIPVGSAVYVETVEPGKIETDDVIAFHSGGSVVVHRVVENRVSRGEFVTKGDANAAEDLYAAGYENLIGRVYRHIPMLGRLLFLYTSAQGKVCAICFAGCGALLNLVAGRLREQQGMEEQKW